MNNFKDNKVFKFILNYKIAIISGIIVTIYIIMTPTNYTNEVANLDKQISTYTNKIEKEESKYIKEVKNTISENIGKIKKEIEILTPEVDALEKTKNELQNQYDEKLIKEAEQKEEEEKKAQKEEEERKAGKWVIESNGYNVWEAYFTPGTYSLSVNHKGRGNCIVYAGTRSNQNQDLLVNEIGSGTFAGTFTINTPGYYTLTFKTDSAFEFEYKTF